MEIPPVEGGVLGWRRPEARFLLASAGGASPAGPGRGGVVLATPAWKERTQPPLARKRSLSGVPEKSQASRARLSR